MNMPTKHKTFCKFPNCPNLITAADRSYCNDHAKYRTNFKRHNRFVQGDYRWNKLSKWYLRNNPLCVKCLSVGLTVAATEVDHIIPRQDGGDNSRENLQSLCKSCHSRKTAKEIAERMRNE